MDISWIIGLGIVGFIIVSLILPWINRSQIQALQREIKKFQAQSQQSEIKAETKTEIKMPEKVVPAISSYSIPHQVQQSKKSKINFEQQFGARLPVWIGGIAIALAGFFLVKYSIEAGLLTEKVRVVTGILFGLVLLTAGSWVRCRPNFSNGVRIAQALIGASIADLYACSFSVTNLYHLVPVWMGFVGMAVITCIAIILSLRHGPPIALMGLLGGLLTPILLNTNTHNTPVLFAYLYLVIAGLLIVIRQKNWWMLFFPAVIGAFLWVIFWMFSPGFVLSDCLWLSIFLIAVSTTFIFCSTIVGEISPSFKLLNILTLCGAVFLVAIISYKSQFDLQTWGLFGLLAIASIILAYFKQKLYGFLPWVLMLVNGIMLFTWSGAAANTIGIMIILFAGLYSISACCVFWRSQNPIQWAGLAGACSVVYYLIGHHQLHSHYSSLFLWCNIAIGLSLLSIIMVNEILDRFNSDQKIKQRLLAIFTLTATTFLSLGLAIILKQKLLPIAFAVQIFVISWINTKVDIKALRNISILLMWIFVILLLPQISFFSDLFIQSLWMYNPTSTLNFSVIDSPVFQLGFPATLLGFASLFFRKKIDDNLVKCLELSGIVLFGFMAYCLTRYIYHGYQSYFMASASFIERGIITDVILSYGLICLWTGRQFLRTTILFSGLMIIGLALSRIIYYDFIFSNPFWTKEFVGNLPVLNSLILPYGLPLLGIYLTNKIVQKSGININIKKYMFSMNMFGLILLFVFLSLNIRQFYQGAYLNGNLTSNAEIYTYSVVWLLMGIGLFLAGTLNHNKFIRIASLIMMILTVGKVFLYDASELTGLYRVFSFLGLGLSLIALSWFYTRFVFKKS